MSHNTEDELPKSLTLPPGAEIKFDYIKSNYFRVIHIDGAAGGVTPQGKIHVGFFSERSAFPQRIVHLIGDDGRLGPEITSERVGRDSVVREIETDVVMDMVTAKSVHEWLGQKIKQLEQISADERTVNAEHSPAGHDRRG